MRPPPPTRTLSLLTLALVLGSSCRSSPADDEEGRTAMAPRPYVDSAMRPDAPIGAFLAEVDARMRAYTTLTLTAKSQADLRKWHVLEQDLVYAISQRKEELQGELETGPPNNRVVAAMALGFVRPPEEGDKMIAPLLSALDDPEPDVVNNALVAIGMLASPNVPASPLARMVGTSPNARVRSNAALALRKTVEAGAPFDSGLLQEVRHGLIDAEPGVVVQCCLMVGLLADAESIGSLAALLPQEPVLVSAAAAKGLALLGLRDVQQKGACARALAIGYGRAPESLRPRIQRALVEMAGVNLGTSADDWMEWANRLP